MKMQSKCVKSKPLKMKAAQRRDLFKLLNIFIDDLASVPFDKVRSRIVDCCVVLLHELEDR